MTYEEYKNGGKQSKKNTWIKKALSKLFTIVIFTMIVIICSNYFPSFRNFLIDEVLNNTMDFSKFNKFMDKFTLNEKEKTQNVSKIIDEESEKYLDGKKIYIKSEDVILKSSGIVVFIGDKEGYGNTVIVQQSNGEYAWYGNIKESVKLYDYVESGNLVGKANDFYYYALYKDDKPILNEN